MESKSKQPEVYNPNENVGKNDFGKRLKELRLERGVKLQDLATAVGTTYTVIYRLESGDKKPKNLKVIRKISNVLGTPELVELARLQNGMEKNTRGACSYGAEEH